MAAKNEVIIGWSNESATSKTPISTLFNIKAPANVMVEVLGDKAGKWKRNDPEQERERLALRVCHAPMIAERRGRGDTRCG